MEKRELKFGDILQLDPNVEDFGGMLLVVTDPKEWGAQGYLMSAYTFEAYKFDGRAFLRVKFEDVEYCGHLAWVELSSEDVKDED